VPQGNEHTPPVDTPLDLNLVAERREARLVDHAPDVVQWVRRARGHAFNDARLSACGPRELSAAWPARGKAGALEHEDSFRADGGGWS
jgi:hypothetical protein